MIDVDWESHIWENRDTDLTLRKRPLTVRRHENQRKNSQKLDNDGEHSELTQFKFSE